MSEYINNIAEYLPEGVGEDVIVEVAKLVDSVINEQVESQVKLLNAKVNGYLRLKIDEIKDHAIKELELENDTFRNARIFEAMKTYMSIELSKDDEETTISELVSEGERSLGEIEVLTEELNKVLIENEKLQNTNKVLSSKVDSIHGRIEDLENEKEELQEAVSKPFKSSEEAVIIAENLGNQPSERVDNEFITKDMMKFMP